MHPTDRAQPPPHPEDEPAIDATERWGPDDELRRLAAIVESSDDAIISETLDGLLTSWNPGAERIYGYRAEEVLGRPRSIIIPPERQDEFPDMLERLRRGERIEYFETVRVRKDGRRIDVSVSMFPIRDASGRTVAAAGIGRDISERRRAESERERLLQAEHQARRAAERSAERIARLQAATAALSEALTPPEVAAAIAKQGLAVLGAQSVLIAQLTADGEDLEVVGALGYRSEQLEGWRRFPLSTAVPLAEAVRTAAPVWPESTSERIARYPHLAEAYANNPPGAWLSVPLIAHGRPIGGMSLSFTRTPVLEEDDRAFVLALARQCAQALDRARLYREAQAAIALRDEFLLVAAHELRTPLATLHAQAQLLLRWLEKGGDLEPGYAAGSLRAITYQSDRLSRLINQLLDVSRVQAGKLALEPRQTDLGELVERVVAAARATTPYRQISLAAPPTLPARVDPFRLEQVLTNLLDNAIKYSPEGGPIEVALRAEVGDRGSGVASQGMSPDARLLTPDRLEVSVRDHGIGIPPEKRAAIFERFYRAHAETHSSGMGLGLYISRQIVELHGGELAAEFPEDGGTRFVVRLPVGVELA